MAKDRRLLLTGSEQNIRWKEHFEEVLNQPEPLSTPEFEDTVMVDSLKVYAVSYTHLTLPTKRIV